MLALFCVIFAICFFLYELPLSAVLYPVLICAVLGIIFIAIDYFFASQKHRQLEDIKKMSAAVIEQMPEIKNENDADYQEIIGNLIDEVRQVETKHNKNYDDMIEYYTVWAHQIKTPIASMRLILENADSAEARKISVQLSKIEQYANMVLAYLRLDSVSSDYVFKKYNLDDIIKGSVKRFSLDFIEKKLKLEYEPVNKEVVTDEKWLGFVLDQILSNALKYTHEGRVKIYITRSNGPSARRAFGECRDSDENYVLCIEDTGIGIAEDDLPRIFERGYTGKNGRIDMRASGLGLYLCKRICKNLGCEISAKSSVDEGTKMFITFPKS